MSHVQDILFSAVFSAALCFSLSACHDSSTSADSAAAATSAPVAGEGGSPPATTPATPPTSAAGTALATVTWLSPTAPAGQEVLGFRIYYGTSPGALTHTVEVGDATQTSYEIKNLTSGMWYFAVASYDADATESSRSGTISAML